MERVGSDNRDVPVIKEPRPCTPEVSLLEKENTRLAYKQMGAELTKLDYAKGITILLCMWAFFDKPIFVVLCR